MLATTPLAVTDDRLIYTYNTEDGSLLKQWEGERATFSPDGTLAIENAGAVRLVDLGKNRVLQAFNGKSAEFSADGQTLALLDRDQIRLYDVSSGKFLQTLESSFKAVSSLQFAPDGRSLAIVGDGPADSLGAPQAEIWQLPDGKSTMVDIQAPLELTYAPHEGTLLIWTADSQPDTTYARRCLRGTSGASLSAGGELTFDVDQVGSGVAGSDLRVEVRALQYQSPLERFQTY